MTDFEFRILFGSLMLGAALGVVAALVLYVVVEVWREVWRFYGGNDEHYY